MQVKIHKESPETSQEQPEVCAWVGKLKISSCIFSNLGLGPRHTCHPLEKNTSLQLWDLSMSVANEWNVSATILQPWTTQLFRGQCLGMGLQKFSSIKQRDQRSPGSHLYFSSWTKAHSSINQAAYGGPPKPFECPWPPSIGLLSQVVSFVTTHSRIGS